MTLIEKIKENEGLKDHRYEDSLGRLTVGYGFLLAALTADELALNGGKYEPMSKETADKILELKLEKRPRSSDRNGLSARRFKG